MRMTKLRLHRVVAGGFLTTVSEEASLCRVACVRGNDGDGCSMVDGAHSFRLGKPIRTIVLDDAEGVYPEMPDVQLPGYVEVCPRS